MMDEQFAKGDSLLHNTAPKVKVVAAFLFVGVVAMTKSFVVATAALVIAAALIPLAGLDSLLVLRRLLAANTFTLFIWLTLPITYGGQPLAQFGPFEISREGVYLAALISLKTNSIVLSLIGLLSTSPVAKLGHALESLHLPKKLCFLLLFSYRYIFVIHQEYLKLARAAQLRCFRPATTVHTYKTIAYLFGMTLVKSWNRSSRIHQAMLLRGFNGRLIPLEQSDVTGRDIFFLAVSLLITGFLLSLHLISW